VTDGDEAAQFDFPQGPIREEDWLALQFGVAFRRTIERSRERGYKKTGDSKQSELVTDGGRDRSTKEITCSVTCENCGGETFAFERDCVNCGTNRWCGNA